MDPPKDDVEYDLYTNTSQNGLGVVLMQQEKVLTYALR